MIQQIATTREQSDRLLQCGVPSESADMYIDSYYELWAVPFKECIRKNDRCSDPAFSLNCLLSLLPKEIYDESGDSFYFSLAKEFPLTEEYGAAYLECWSAGHEPIVRKRDNDPIEACVQLIEWLIDNGHKLNGIEKGGEDV